MDLATLNDRLEEINTRSSEMVKVATDAKRDLSTEEQDELDGLLTEFESVKANRDRLAKIELQGAMLSKPEGRKTEPAGTEPPATGKTRISGGGFRNDDKTRWGWRNFGEQALAIRDAGAPGGRVDQRLLTESRSGTAPTTFGSEIQGADGGFAIAPDFRNTIMEKVQSEESLMSRTDQGTSGSNSVTYPVDETTDWQTSGGIQANWEGEGDALSQSKPALKNKTWRLNKLGVLIPVTEELLEDAQAMGSYLNRKAPAKIDFKINLAIVQGNGTGQPLGILNSPDLVTVAKEGSQVADTVVTQNIVKMWSRCYAPSRRRAVWLINQDIEPQLNTMSLIGKLATGADDTGWGVPTYMPAGGISGSPFATLYGRPVIETQACETLGDLGDIILADLNEYHTITKTGGIRQDVSIHLWFDFDVTAFRFIMRVAGQSWLTAPISPRDGSNTLSPFVALAARA